MFPKFILLGEERFYESGKNLAKGYKERTLGTRLDHC